MTRGMSIAFSMLPRFKTLLDRIMITIVSGTNRAGSQTRKIAAEVHQIYQHLGQQAEVLDLADLPLDLLLPSAYETKPREFAHWTDTILASSGLVVVTPEYNGSFPGVLKLFIDMLPFPESFEHRPVSFIGLAAGSWGGLRAVEQLQQIFGYRNAWIFPHRVFIPQIHQVMDGEGQLRLDVKERLTEQARGFTKFIGRLQAGQ